MDAQSGPSRSWGFAGAVLVCGVLGLAAAVFAGGARRPPAYALNSTLIYRCEIGGVVFVILYFVVVLTRLASYGRTPTSIGASGAKLPQLPHALLSDALAGYQTVAARLDELPDQIIDEMAALRHRVEALEQAPPAEREHGQ
ncbi:MAG TPA: hypothetical protein VIH71_06940 [Solirubrobacteraceae bacterium]